MATTRLSDLLDESVVRYEIVAGYEEKFIPDDELNRLITETNVTTELHFQSELRHPGDLRYLTAENIPQIRRVLGILGLGETNMRFEVLHALLQDGLCDDDLPLERCDARLKSIDFDKTFESLSDLLTAAGTRSFLDCQSIVLSPYFNGGEDIQSRDRDLKISLPLQEQDSIARTQFSEVYKAKLEPSHRSRQVGAVVAIKRFNAPKDFDKEREILKQLQNLRNEHLIKHVSTVAWGGRCYVLFPWASGGNLREFWDREKCRDFDMYTWAFGQIQGITEALSELYDINCRHGDLKPENILHFNEGGSSRLVVSDVGLAKIHMKVTDAREGRTSTNAFTLAYEAPDQMVEHGKPLSRKFDSWSLGCILLEFVIWLLYGAGELEEFCQARTTRAGDSCRFYETHEQTVVVHGAVNAWIHSMQKDDPRCKTSETAVGDLLCIVKDKLLQIEPKKRAEPKNVSDDIKRLIQNAYNKDDYMFQLTVDDKAVCKPSVSLTDIIAEAKNSQISSFHAVYEKNGRSWFQTLGRRLRLSNRR